MRALSYRLNSYIAILIVTMVGSAAALVIIHVAHTDVKKIVLGSEAPMYSALQK